MFKNIKKRATTIFRKKASGSTTDLPPEYDAIDTTTTDNPPFRYTYSAETTETELRDTRTDPTPPLPPAPTAVLAVPAVPAHIEDEPVVEDPSQNPTTDPEPPEPNYYGRKYVPYIEASPLKNNMLVNAGVYGRINPDIMGGFGSDDDSIWLVDDEETDEELQRRDDNDDEATREALAETQGQNDSNHHSETRSHRSNRSQNSPQPTSSRDSLHEVTIMLAQEPVADAPSTKPAQPAFTYSKPSLLDDDEFASFSNTGREASPRSFTSQTAPSRGYAPISSSILDLSDMGLEDLEEPTRDSPKLRSESASHEPKERPNDEALASSSSSVNPYVALFEQQDLAMTVAYLRRLDQEELTDDFRFGQRYQKASDTPDIIVTRQRVPASTVTGDLECIVCTENKGVELFPRFSITASCSHPPTTCLECVQFSIESDINSKLWTDIRCPECREMLEYTDIQRYANKQTFMRYETLALRAAMSEADNFVWCTSGCGSGQIHESGDDQPIVTCLHCTHRSCFHHGVSWHENLTCDEYNQLLADPENFRSRIELENEAWSESQRAQLEADRTMAQNLLAGEQAEIQRREERARREREQAQKAAELVRQIAARRKREDQQSQAMVSLTTKPCPGCGWAIEKNDGCSHMTCSRCYYEFCFECGANHKEIVAGDNTVHKDTCKFHPDNMDWD